jgi:predicted nucleic acid-binding protein
VWRGRGLNSQHRHTIEFSESLYYIVTRDKDLLSLREHEGISIMTPEAFLQVLRMP